MTARRSELCSRTGFGNGPLREQVIAFLEQGHGAKAELPGRALDGQARIGLAA